MKCLFSALHPQIAMDEKVTIRLEGLLATQLGYWRRQGAMLVSRLGVSPLKSVVMLMLQILRYGRAESLRTRNS